MSIMLEIVTSDIQSDYFEGMCVSTFVNGINHIFAQNKFLFS